MNFDRSPYSSTKRPKLIMTDLHEADNPKYIAELVNGHRSSYSSPLTLTHPPLQSLITPHILQRSTIDFSKIFLQHMNARL